MYGTETQIQVVKLGYKPKPNEVLCYVGRNYFNDPQHGINYSSLGNHHKITDQQDRAAVIELFRQDLWKAIQGANPPMYNAFMSLNDKHCFTDQDIALVCHCAPKYACHADIIKKALQWAKKTYLMPF